MGQIIVIYNQDKKLLKKFNCQMEVFKESILKEIYLGMFLHLRLLQIEILISFTNIIIIYTNIILRIVNKMKEEYTKIK